MQDYLQRRIRLLCFEFCDCSHGFRKVNFIEWRNKKNERTKPHTNWYIWSVEIGWKGKSWNDFIIAPLLIGSRFWKPLNIFSFLGKGPLGSFLFFYYCWHCVKEGISYELFFLFAEFCWGCWRRGSFACVFAFCLRRWFRQQQRNQCEWFFFASEIYWWTS